MKRVAAHHSIHAGINLLGMPLFHNTVEKGAA